MLFIVKETFVINIIDEQSITNKIKNIIENQK